ncbi:class I SAM-dependent methyltransferase [Bradyrhizobium sp. STM 3562]|uniref:class I SAM-dependent methyltransferase n=1 Tax=Bradyrhizobium sp. STM 3562 TaxID=578924 RepID=UPI00388D702A
MDQSTLEAYDRKAAFFAADWGAQPTPTDLQEIIRRFFRRGLTADIGCGSGRDTAWLCQNGFPAIGYDPSEGLLAEARRLHPSIQFRRNALPELEDVANSAFANVLCETVIMHLAPAVIPAAVRRLLCVLEPEGTLYLSWRVNETGSSRDEHGRLYAYFDEELVKGALNAATILLDERLQSASSGKVIRRIVARKSAAQVDSS